MTWCFAPRWESRIPLGIFNGVISSPSLLKRRETVIKSKGALGADIDKYNLSYLLKGILIEQAPESIPMLIDLVESDSNGYVREEALTVLALIGTFRMRLRRTEIGGKAIEAIHKAVERGDLKPVHTTREARDSLWRQLSDGILNDQSAEV